MLKITMTFVHYTFNHIIIDFSDYALSLKIYPVLFSSQIYVSRIMTGFHSNTALVVIEWVTIR